jgi:hypothetical protein
MGGALGAFLAIPEALVLGLIVTGTGRKLCRRLLPDASPVECSVFGFPVGMALLSVFMSALLFARVPAAALPFTLGAALAAAAAAARADALDVVRELRDFARGCPALAAVFVGSAAVGAVGCLAPETGWDTGVYHFALARLRAEQGAMVVRLDLPHSYRPGALESIQAAGFLLNGEALASLVNEAFYFAGAALARLWGLRLGGSRGGVFAALAWFTSITFVLRMDGGDVEAAQAVYFGVAALALLRLRDGRVTGWRALAGLGVGMLVGLKYASCFVVGTVAVVWIARRLIDRAPWRSLLADGAVLGAFILVIGGPWYLRNKLATGGFLYPFHSATFSDPGEVAHAGAAMVLLRALGLNAFALVGLAGAFTRNCAKDRWVLAVPVLLLIWLVRQLGWQEANLTNAVRYATPAWLALLAFGGVGVAWAVERGGWLRLAGLGTIGAGLVLGQGVLLKRNLPKLPVALGVVSREAYLEGRVSTYRAIREAEAGLPPGKKILLVEERVYYCRASFLCASDLPGRAPFARIDSIVDLRRFLHAESIGAIVVDRTPSARAWTFHAMELKLGTDWPPPEVRAVTIPGNASLYRVD